jgi:hypothetical protein
MFMGIEPPDIKDADGENTLCFLMKSGGAAAIAPQRRPIHGREHGG